MDIENVAMVGPNQTEESAIDNVKEALGPRYPLIGNSAIFNKTLSIATKTADSGLFTFITGESGTGKTLIARLIHRFSSRKHKPMVILNCGSFPESLLESELFGHEKGAYTGAHKSRKGKFDAANGGILLLDEIGEMSPTMQVKLLQVIEEGVFYRVGSTDVIEVDVRVLAATNKDITKEILHKRFREDLYYRLSAMQIDIPPLRDRLEDIVDLMDYFLKIASVRAHITKPSISEKAMGKILNYQWPGNIRELRNVIERSFVLGDRRQILPADIQFGNKLVQRADALRIGISLREALNAFKKEFIKINLIHAKGNRAETARAIDIQRTYLSRLISEYDLKDF